MHESHFADCWVKAQRASARERHRDRPTRGCATNGVEQRRLDGLVQRKRAGIHDGHCGNKVDGLFGLDDLNKTTSRTAGRGLKVKTRRQQTRQAAKQNK